MKKVLVVCICLVVICAVFGVNSRLDYPGFKHAFEDITTDASVLSDDLNAFGALATIVSDYSPTRHREIYVEEVVPEEGDNVYALVYVAYNNTFPDDDGLDLVTENWVFSDYSTADRLCDILSPLVFEGVPDLNNPFTDVLASVNSIGFVLMLIVSFALVLISILFDLVAVAFTLVKSGLYLLGF